MSSVLFYLFSIGLIACALGVILAPSPMYSVLSLVVSICFLAGLFALLKAHFIATIIVLVYAGAILVLFIFVVMLLDPKQKGPEFQGLPFKPAGAGLLGILLAWQIWRVAQTTQLPSSFEGIPPAQGTAEAMGQLLFQRYLLPFELTSILILAAVISVVVLAKRDWE